jgi:hypothetical protein
VRNTGAKEFARKNWDLESPFSILKVNPGATPGGICGMTPAYGQGFQSNGWIPACKNKIFAHSLK